MTYLHRKWHLAVWVGLAALLAVGLIAGLGLRSDSRVSPRSDVPQELNGE